MGKILTIVIISALWGAVLVFAIYNIHALDETQRLLAGLAFAFCAITLVFSLVMFLGEHWDAK